MNWRYRNDRGIFRTLFASLGGTQRNRMDEILELIGLPERRDDLAGELSHGQKQWLEIGMLLIQDTQLLSCSTSRSPA